MIFHKKLTKYTFFLALLSIVFVQQSLASERPTVHFDDQTFYLVNFYRSSSKTVETYIPKGQTLSTFTKQIERIELHDISSQHVAAEGLAYQYDNNRLPHKLIKNGQEPILLGTFYSPLHAAVLDKEIFIFKKPTGSHRVVYYSYLEREFLRPNSEATKKRLENKDSLLMDEVFISKIKELDID